jgi:hypothetical protein
MVFQCFLDDSKDQDQSKVFVSAGFISTLVGWKELRSAWSKCLKENGQEYFKTSEYKMLNGQFARFKTAAYPPPNGRQRASGIRDAFLAIHTGMSNIKAFGCSIPMQDYLRVCSRSESKDFFETQRWRVLSERCRAVSDSA